MSTLDEFDVEPIREVRTPKRVDGLDYLACPCSSPLVVSAIGTVEVDAERTSPDALDTGNVLFRGWDCSACSRVVLDTVAVAREEGRERDLRDGWYPIRVHVDLENSAIAFAPKPHVDELLDDSRVSHE